MVNSFLPDIMKKALSMTSQLRQYYVMIYTNEVRYFFF